MLAGRTIAGVVSFFMLTYFLPGAFRLNMLMTAMFITALPGIIIQLVMIPIMVRLLQSANLLYREKGEVHVR